MTQVAHILTDFVCSRIFVGPDNPRWLVVIYSNQFGAVDVSFGQSTERFNKGWLIDFQGICNGFTGGNSVMRLSQAIVVPQPSDQKRNLFDFLSLIRSRISIFSPQSLCIMAKASALSILPTRRGVHGVVDDSGGENLLHIAYDVFLESFETGVWHNLTCF